MFSTSRVAYMLCRECGPFKTILDLNNDYPTTNMLHDAPTESPLMQLLIDEDILYVILYYVQEWYY